MYLLDGEILRKMISVDEETHTKLTKLKGELTTQLEDNISYGDIVKYLYVKWEENRDE